jgi:tartrate-resistant acid phosphatase type 5
MNVAPATDEGEDDVRSGRTRAMSAHLRSLRAAFSRAPFAYAGVGAVLLLVLLVPWLSNSRLLALFSAPAIGNPVLPGASSLTFVAQGDWGRRGGEGQELVAPMLADWARRVRTPMVISVGDNFYNSGLSSVSDEGVVSSFTHPYSAPSLAVPWYAVLGNHDMRGTFLPCGAQAAGLDPRWVCPHPFYAAAWDRGTGREVVGPRSAGTWAALATGAHACLAAVFIDTVPLTLYYRKPAYVKHVGKDGGAFVANIASATQPAVQMAWIREALVNASAGCDAVIVVGHHPVFSAGEHGNSEDLLRDLKPLLDAHGVDAYFSGHDHTLNHLVKDGVQYVLTGAGSEAAGTGPSRPSSGPPTPETTFLEDTHGFTVHSLNGSHMSHTYVRYDGSLRFQAVAKLRAKRREA